MRIFISGGCKNGKSFYAQHIAKAQCANNETNTGRLYYIATMKPIDTEDELCIARHRKDREGWGFTTVEQPVDIEKIMDACDSGGSFLLDSVTALLSNEMFLPNGTINENAGKKIISGLSFIIKNTENIVIVSDFIYSDATFYDPLTEKFRKSLAQIDRAVSGIADAVVEIAYTNVIVHKGGAAFDAVYKKIS